MNEREEEKPDKNGDSGDSEDDSHLPLELLAMQASHDDDDDDDDNWSRQVETDETGVAGGDESVSMREAMESLTVSEQQQQLQQEQQTGHLNNANSESRHEGREHIVTQASASASNSGIIPLGPVQPELTMKEKLVLRERQRRIETQRARLKRQFALSNAQEGEDYLAAQNLLDSSGQLQLSEAAVRVVRDNGSAAGTLGEESTVAHPDEDGVVGQDNAQEEKLGFNMERFLRNGDSFNPELESTAEDKATGVPNSSTAPADKGPVMERFLNEPVVVGDNTSSEMDAPKSSEPPTNASTEVQRSVSFEVNMMDVAATDENSELGGDDIPGVRSLPSFNETTPSMDANVSVLVHADEDDVARDPLIMSMTSMDAQESVVSVEDGVMMPNTGSASTSSSRNEEPRFLRLTEADMQEMAAIEEASIGNGPPSDRSEEGLSESEIGELADFRGGHHNHHNHVHDAAGNLSQDTPTTAMDSASMLSGGNQSAQPTSATSDHDHDHIGDQHSLDGMPSVSVSSQLLVSPGEASANNNPMSDTARDEEDHRQERGRTSELTHQPILEDDDHSDSSSSEVLVNRRLRPGMGNHLRPQNARSASTGPSTTAVQAPTSPLVVEGFDFDKDEPMSPHTDDHDDSLRDLPDDGWSPGTGKMSTSPIRIRSSAAKLSPTEEEEFAAQSRTYGSIVGEEQGRGGAPNFPSMKAASNNRNNESQPLLGDVPPEITTRRQASEGVSGSEVYPSSLRSVLHGHGKGSDVDEAALYNSSSVLKKGKGFSLYRCAMQFWCLCTDTLFFQPFQIVCLYSVRHCSLRCQCY